jgi:hypothetical protein
LLVPYRYVTQVLKRVVGRQLDFKPLAGVDGRPQQRLQVDILADKMMPQIR